LNFSSTAWSNTGLITETNATLNLGGTFTASNLGNYSRTGGNINLVGTLTNTGSTLTLDAAHGSWNLIGGTVQGGTILGTGGATLIATTGSGTLSGVTLKGDASQVQPVVLDVSNNGVNVTVSGDLTLDNATINMQGIANVSFSSATAMLGGTGAVVF